MDKKNYILATGGCSRVGLFRPGALYNLTSTNLREFRWAVFSYNFIKPTMNPTKKYALTQSRCNECYFVHFNNLQEPQKCEGPGYVPALKLGPAYWSAKLEIVVCSNKFVGTALVPTKLVGTACGNSCSHKFVGTDYLVFQQKINALREEVYYMEV